jgi:hypothetical protein
VIEMIDGYKRKSIGDGLCIQMKILSIARKTICAIRRKIGDVRGKRSNRRVRMQKKASCNSLRTLVDDTPKIQDLVILAENMETSRDSNGHEYSGDHTDATGNGCLMLLASNEFSSDTETVLNMEALNRVETELKMEAIEYNATHYTVTIYYPKSRRFPVEYYYFGDALASLAANSMKIEMHDSFEIQNELSVDEGTIPETFYRCIIAKTANCQELAKFMMIRNLVVDAAISETRYPSLDSLEYRETAEESVYNLAQKFQDYELKIMQF